MRAVSRDARHRFVLAVAATMGWWVLTGPAAMAGDHRDREDREDHKHGEHCEHGKPRPPRPDPAVLRAFDELLEDIKELPRRSLPHGEKTSLYVKVASARHVYKHKKVCPSASILGGFLHRTQALRWKPRRRAVAEELYASGRTLRDLVLAQALPPSPCFDPSIGREPEVEILASDNERFSARVRFGAPRLAALKAGPRPSSAVSTSRKSSSPTRKRSNSGSRSCIAWPSLLSESSFACRKRPSSSNASSSKK